MHFKKMILLDGYHKKEVNPSSQETFTAESGINVNHSVTDQIAKLSSVKGERLKTWNNNDLSPPSRSVEDPVVQRGGREGGGGGGGGVLVGNKQYTISKSDSRMDDGASFGKTADQSQQSAPQNLSREGPPISTHSRTDALRARESERESLDRDIREMEREREHELRERLCPSMDERSLSRSSTTSSSASISRVEELRRTTGPVEGHGSSPLIFDKNEPVRVYRDPELLKKDELRFIQHARHSSSHTPGPPTHSQGSSYQGVPGSMPAAGPQSHQGHPVSLASPHHASSMTQHSAGQRTLMSPQLPYGTHMSSSLTSLSQQLQLQHHLATASPMDPNALRALSSLTPHQQQALQLQYGIIPSGQHVLPQYALHNNIQTAQLEFLWQQKYPTLPVPPPWMLLQYQEELLRDRNLIALERERRDRELAHERERADRVERERSIERERAKREAVERERADRELRERAERERIERERERSVTSFTLLPFYMNVMHTLL